MDEKLLNLLLDASQSKGDGSASKLTSEEAKKFKAAFADPEFRRLFAEYADELADPKNREETEAYISQLEEEQKVPEGKELIRPSPGFVVKTKRIGKNSTDKIFINIVQSDKIEKPTKRLHKVDGKEGYVWSLPYSVGPPHMEKDKKGDNVPCFDCCFHPEALQLSAAHEKFRELVINTSMDGIDQLFTNQNQNAKLDRNFHIVKGVTYKSGIVPSLLVKKESKKNWETNNDDSTTSNSSSSSSSSTSSSSSSTSSSSSSSTSTPTQIPKSQLPSPPKEAQTINKPKPTGIKKGFLNSAKTQIYKDKIDTIRPKNIPEKSFLSDSSPESASAHDDIVSELLSSSNSKSSTPSETNISTSELKEVSSKSVSRTNKPIAPTYTFKQRENTSLGDFQGIRAESSSTRPSELVYEINLPLVTSPSKVALDVSTKRLVLNYLDVYSLEIDLPYPVYDVKGKASYDKAKKILKIILPVIPEDPKSSNQPSSVVKEITDEKIQEIEPKEEEIKEVKPIKTPKSSTIETKSHPNKEEILRFKEEILKQAELAKELALKEQEEKKKNSEQNNFNSIDPTPVPTSAPSDDNQQDEDAEFIFAETFEGPKKNYYFSNGDYGLGYYKDFYAIEKKNEHLNASEQKLKKDLVIEERVQQIPEKKNQEVLEDTKFVEYKIPSHDIKQTDQTVAILIQVPSINAASVDISLTNMSLKLKFSTISNETFGCVFKLDNCTILGWSPTEMKYDVAENNMIIVVKKNEKQFWKGRDSNNFIETSPYKEEIVNEAKEKNSTSSIPASTPIDFNAQQAINSLQLSSNYISELD